MVYNGIIPDVGPKACVVLKITELFPGPSSVIADTAKRYFVSGERATILVDIDCVLISPDSLNRLR